MEQASEPLRTPVDRAGRSGGRGRSCERRAQLGAAAGAVLVRIIDIGRFVPPADAGWFPRPHTMVIVLPVDHPHTPMRRRTATPSTSNLRLRSRPRWYRAAEGLPYWDIPAPSEPRKLWRNTAPPPRRTPDSLPRRVPCVPPRGRDGERRVQPCSAPDRELGRSIRTRIRDLPNRCSSWPDEHREARHPARYSSAQGVGTSDRDLSEYERMWTSERDQWALFRSGAGAPRRAACLSDPPCTVRPHG